MSDELPKYKPPKAVVDELLQRFTYHAPFGNQVARYGELRSTGLVLAHLVLTQTPPGREQSLAITNIEQAIFWANAAIARNEFPKPEADAQP